MKHFIPCYLCILDLRPGGSARLRHSVACAAGPDHPARHPAEHHAALLPRKPPLPAHRPQPGGGGQNRSVLRVCANKMATLGINETESRITCEFLMICGLKHDEAAL